LTLAIAIAVAITLPIALSVPISVPVPVAVLVALAPSLALVLAIPDVSDAAGAVSVSAGKQASTLCHAKQGTGSTSQCASRALDVPVAVSETRSNGAHVLLHNIASE
jgi:hypothetical protein